MKQACQRKCSVQSNRMLSQLPQMQEMLGRFNYAATMFDQCQYGLTSPKGYPMQKNTRLMYCNLKMVKLAFCKKCMCAKVLNFGKGMVSHRKIEVSELGHQLSRWAQSYPPDIVAALVAVCKHNCDV